MRGKVIQIGFVIAAMLFGTAAAADTTRTAVQDCMRKTGTAGAYAVSVTQGVPRVTAGTGGSTSGAALINDCLADRYQVQYDAVARGVVETNEDEIGGVALCKRIRNQRILTSVAVATGFALGVDSSAAIAGGVAGAGYTSWRARRTYRECIADAAAPKPQSGIALIRDCGRGSNIFQGGSSYCRD